MLAFDIKQLHDELPKMARKRKTPHEVCCPHLVRLMGFVHGCQCTKDQTFAEAQLLELTPDHVSKCFNMLACGKQVPGPNDKPNKCRHTNLEQVKKAVSCFHPNKLQPWNAQAKCGNPTRSVPVNDVIKEVKRAEVRKQGVPSRAKRDLKRQEFRKTLRMLEASRGDVDWKRKFPSVGSAAGTASIP